MFQKANHIGWKYAALALLFVTAVLMFTRLGSYPMQMQWEPNYGQVLREMVWGQGDFITPASRVGADEGADYGWFWSKPILVFWLAYPLQAMFGSADSMPNPWLFRIPNAFVGLLGVLMMIYLMTRLYSRRTGVISGLVYATTTIYFVIARAYIVDILFVNFWFISLGFFFLGEKFGKKKYYYLFYLFIGVSMLAKGLLPLILTGGILFFYLIVTWDWKLLKRMNIPKGLVIFLAIGFAWYLYMIIRFGSNYAYIFFYKHHFARATGTLDKPDDTFEMFVLNFAVGVLPWLTFLPQAVATALPWNKGTADRKPELWFVLGLGFTFMFFCVIGTKFPHYIFPTAPMAALLIGLYLDRWVGADLKNFNRISVLIGLLTFAIVAPDMLDKKNYRIIWYFMNTERLQDWHASIGDPRVWFTYIYALWAATLVLTGVFKKYYRFALPVLGVLAFTYAFYITNHMVPQLNWMFSSRTLFQTYYDEKGDDDIIAEFTQTWKSRSIKFEMHFDELANKYDYRKYRLRDNLNSVKNFYEQHVRRPDGTSRRVWFIIEQKQKHFSRIQNLWRRATGGEMLVKIMDDGDPDNKHGYKAYNPEFWLVSNYGRDKKMEKVSRADIRKMLKRYVKDDIAQCDIAVHHEALLGRDKGIKMLGYELMVKRAGKNTATRLNINDWKLDKPEVHSGDKVVIRTFWTVTKPVNRDLELFIHAERPMGFRLRGDHVPVNNEYPVPEWKVGQCIMDEYEIDIPKDTPTGDMDIYIGMFKGNDREPVDARPWREPDNRIKLGSLIVRGKY